ncbi:MAG: prepilin-type N-terminal cleavage/methylation domain-containing protein [Desulfobacterales bacterium]|jgi:prepilin-type N-terminal cleavage/methylation domain-containing protein
MSNSCCNDRGGFTLLEIIATLVIISVLAAIAVPRYLTLDENTRQKAIDAGIGELNGRETLTWSNQKIGEGYLGDVQLFLQVDTNLGEDYRWEEADGPDAGGGTLIFQQNTSVALTRSVSTTVRPGTWSR